MTMNMKTEYCENDTTFDRAPEINRLANLGDTGATTAVQRFSTACLTRLSELKERVTDQLRAEYGTSVSATLLKHSVQEADSIAATTLFPSLFLPTLAEERVQLASAWSNRHKQIRKQSQAFAE